MSVAMNIMQTLVIARRDLTARVWTPVFLLVLFAPIAMLLLSSVAMYTTGRIGDKQAERSMVAVVDGKVGARMIDADKGLRIMLPRDDSLPRLRIVEPKAGDAEQARDIVTEGDGLVTAALQDRSDGGSVLVAYRRVGTDASWLRRVRQEADRTPMPGVSITSTSIEGEGLGNVGRDALGKMAIMVMFLIIYLLGSQVGSSLIEERSNKIIDVLAAATPLECILFGKLMAEYAVAMIFMGFYGGIVLTLPALLPAEANPFIGAIGRDAGWSFVPLFAMYFTTAYLIYSATIIALGSLATNPQSSKLLLLPMGLLQFGALAAATAVSGKTEGSGFLMAAVFPYTSPLVMTAAHFSDMPAWKHAAAVAWQMSYIVLILWIAARVFRRTALQSGPAPSRSRLRKMKKAEQDRGSGTD
jgi:ABC-2 type transport system permease protein